MISWRHALWIIPLALAFGILLGGCTTMTDHDRAVAHKEPGFYRKPIIAVYVENPDIVCRRIVGANVWHDERILACADPYGKINPKVCTIIYPYNPPAWMQQHERDHCLYGSWHG